MKKHKVIGQSPRRVDGVDKVTGSGQFIADIALGQMLQVAVLRSSHAHALLKIAPIDKILPKGVHAIVTGEGAMTRQGFIANARIYRFGSCIADQTPMALGKVRYCGEAIAAVVAETKEAAHLALKKLRVDYHPLPHVITPIDAVKQDAVLIHEEMAQYKVLPQFKPCPGSNVYHHYRLIKGNAELELTRAARTFEYQFVYPHISHGQLEPHGCIAHWQRDGELSIHSSSQSPWYVRKVLSTTFGVPCHRVKVSVPYVGGGFGGKSDVTIEPLVTYIASFVPGHPVRYILTREEMFIGTVLGRGCYARVKTGMVGSKIVAMKAELLFQSGAYGDCNINVVTAAGHNCAGPYRIDHLQVDSKGVYTNTPFVGAFRGYGHPEGHWMMDRNMELIANELKIDSYSLRCDNLLVPGDQNALGQTITEKEGRLRQCVDFVYDQIKDCSLSEDDKLYGYGITPIMKSPVIPVNAASCATLRFHEDATVSLAVSGIDIGQGSSTALTQIAAEALSFPFEQVNINRMVKTEYTPYEWQTVASKTTWTVGRAIIKAADKAIVAIKNTASLVLKTTIENLVYDGEKVYVKGQPKRKVMLKEIIMGHVDEKGHLLGGPVITHGYYIPPDLEFPDSKTGQGNVAGEWTFGCQGVVIAVDAQTAEIEIIKMVTALDAGKIIHPQMARAQVVGSMVQALGAAMLEELKYDQNGKVWNNSFTDYKIPGCEDFADSEIIVHFIESHFEEGPFGARCLAEHGTVGMASALGNAVFHATGINFHRLPITAEKLLIKIKEAGR